MGRGRGIELPEGTDELALLERAIDRGVSFDPGFVFRPAPTFAPPSATLRGPAKPGLAGRPALRASFSCAPIDQLAEGARRLARCISDASP